MRSVISTQKTIRSGFINSDGAKSLAAGETYQVEVNFGYNIPGIAPKIMVSPIYWGVPGSIDVLQTTNYETRVILRIKNQTSAEIAASDWSASWVAIW